MQRQLIFSVIRETLTRVRGDLAIFLSITLFATTSHIFLAMNNARENAVFGKYLFEAMFLGLLVFPICVLAADTACILHRFDRRRSLVLRRVFSPRRIGFLISGSAMLIAVMYFGGVFSSVKSTLVIWQGGFHFDRQLADIDAFLHFGVDPWRLVTPLMDSAAARLFVGYNYSTVWSAIAFGTVFFVAQSPRAASIRSRYLVSFMLVWVLLGNVLAGLFMSAGPVFYAQVTGDGARFAGLSMFLEESAALGDNTGMYQAYLWSLRESGQSGFASGISAFPSVHVGLIVMNTMFAWDANRKFGWAMIAYSLLIMASSVGLGWHYAVDGYVSAILVILMHVGLKRFYGWQSRTVQESFMRPVSAV